MRLLPAKEIMIIIFGVVSWGVVYGCHASWVGWAVATIDGCGGNGVDGVVIFGWEGIGLTF